MFLACAITGPLDTAGRKTFYTAGLPNLLASFSLPSTSEMKLDIEELVSSQMKTTVEFSYLTDDSLSGDATGCALQHIALFASLDSQGHAVFALHSPAETRCGHFCSLPCIAAGESACLSRMPDSRSM